jgi:hypothetical protein
VPRPEPPLATPASDRRATRRRPVARLPRPSVGPLVTSRRARVAYKGPSPSAPKHRHLPVRRAAPKPPPGPPRRAHPSAGSPRRSAPPVAVLAPTKARAAACHSGRARPSPDSEPPRLAPTVAAEPHRRRHHRPGLRSNPVLATPALPRVHFPGQAGDELAGICSTRAGHHP